MFIIITQDDYMMQVALQPAMECLPLVMEPESNFYQDPVVILDFQSLYPSMIIAYNLCYSTCLGKVLPSKTSVLGVSSYSADALLKNLNEQLLTPNGVMYVPSKVSFNAFYLYNSLFVYDIVHGINFTIQLGKTIYAQKKSQLWAVLNAVCLNLVPKIFCL